jgi:hypothetical protein
MCHEPVFLFSMCHEPMFLFGLCHELCYVFPSDDEDETFRDAKHELEMMDKYGAFICAFDMYYDCIILDKKRHREPELTGYDWVMRTLNDPEECFNMFRMNRDLFERLHDLPISKHGLQSTWHMSSIEALAMFLWIVGAPQSIR